MCLANTKGQSETHTELFVLAFVFDVRKEPVVALFPDPWQLRQRGSFTLETSHEFEGWFSGGTRAIYVRSGMGPAAQLPGKEAFKYQSLKYDEIRLLNLLPGADNEPIKGSIWHAPLSSVAAGYVAVSYAWGMKERRPFYFEETGANAGIEVTRNLDSVLRVLRNNPKYASTPLWIDAICVNQSDKIEKGLQVQQMGNIFRDAKEVVAWLGDEENSSHETLETLEEMHAGGQIPARDSRFWGNANDLVGRPWFHRAWIVQELVMPSRVVMMCGPRSQMGWEAFFGGIRRCERGYHAAYAHTSDEGNMDLLPKATAAYALGHVREKLKAGQGEHYTLLELLEFFSHTRAGIEADKLFSLLSLACDVEHRRSVFYPDYDSELEDVVRTYIKGFVDRDQGMELLYRAGRGKSYFSSWIPRLTRNDFPKTISTWDAATPFAAAPRDPAAITACGSMPKLLRAKGCIVDTIRRTNPIGSGQGSSYAISQAMNDFARLLEPTAQDSRGYPTGETADRILLRLPIGNARRPHLEATMDQWRWYRDVGTTPEWGGTSGGGDDGEDAWPADLSRLVLPRNRRQSRAWYRSLSWKDKKTVSKYWQTAAAFSTRLSGAIFCATEARYVGLVPAGAQSGDHICLLHGAKVPFVLRSQGSGGTWELIGEGYIHGIMAGEALNQPRTEVEFTLE
jgi:hypothetical protein